MLKRLVAFVTGGWILLAAGDFAHEPVVTAVGTLLCAAGLLTLAERNPR